MNRFAICGAYWLIANRYHSGQWSKGYEILSRLALLGFKPGLRPEHDQEFRDHAAALLWSRRREILASW